MSKNTFSPNYCSMPGDILRDYLETRNISQAQLSRNSGLSEKVISKIISGKTAITANSALALEQPLGMKANFWLALQSNYDLFHAKIKRDENIAKPKAIHDHYVLSWCTEGQTVKFTLEEFKTLDETIARAIILENPGTSCPIHIQDSNGIIFINDKELFGLMDEKKAGSGIKAAE